MRCDWPAVTALAARLLITHEIDGKKVEAMVASAVPDVRWRL